MKRKKYDAESFAKEIKEKGEVSFDFNMNKVMELYLTHGRFNNKIIRELKKEYSDFETGYLWGTLKNYESSIQELIGMKLSFDAHMKKIYAELQEEKEEEGEVKGVS